MAELDPNDLWELTRKCHLFRSLDISGWRGVSVLAFRSLGLAVGASLEAVRQCDAGRARPTSKTCSRLIWSQTDHLHIVWFADKLRHLVRIHRVGALKRTFQYFTRWRGCPRVYNVRGSSLWILPIWA